MKEKELTPYLSQINRLNILISLLYEEIREKDSLIQKLVNDKSRNLQIIDLLKLKTAILEDGHPYVDEIGEHQDQISMVL